MHVASFDDLHNQYETPLNGNLCRRDFGNNPDISKALRLLVSEKNVKRVGKGGRVDPFTYQVSYECIRVFNITMYSQQDDALLLVTEG